MILEQFSILTDSERGQHLVRVLVLELAIRGKLVPQSMDDEPSSALLKRISELRGHQIFKPARPDRSAATNQTELPESWDCVALKSIATKIGSGATPSGGRNSYKSEGIPFVRSQNVRFEGFTGEGLAHIDPQQAAKLANVELHSWDVLLNITGASIGRVCVCPPEISGGRVNQHVCLIRPVLYLPEVLCIFLSSPGLQKRIDDIQVGATRQAITKAQIENLQIPVPPLPEQKRIVAKVEELTNLCDRLENAHQTRNKLRDDFAASALDNLTRAQTPDQLQPAWTIIKNNFPTITATPNSIAKIRETILKLAVQGKLVSQDPSDETAKVLLARISGDVLFAEDEKKEELHPLPSNWRWASFPQIAKLRTNLVDPKDYADFPHVAPDTIEKMTGRLLPYKTVREDEVISKNHLFFEGQILYSKIRPNLNKVTLAPFTGLCSADMYPIESLIDTEYLLLFMLSKAFVRQAVDSDNRVAMPKINQRKLNLISVAVPPLGEQKRIVAKVNELMAICDKLEEALKAKNQKAAAFAQSVIAHSLDNEGANSPQLVEA